MKVLWLHRLELCETERGGKSFWHQGMLTKHHISLVWDHNKEMKSEPEDQHCQRMPGVRVHFLVKQHMCFPVNNFVSLGLLLDISISFEMQRVCEQAWG